MMQVAESTDEATRYNDTDETSKTEGEKKKNTNKNTSLVVHARCSNTPAPSFRDHDAPAARKGGGSGARVEWK